MKIFLMVLAFFLIVMSVIGLRVRADVLDDALVIVVNQSPSLQGHEVLLGISEKKKIWTSKLALGANYAQADTFDSASGTDLRARLTFEIPLFDDGGKGKTVAEQKQQLAVEKDRVIGAFLSKVSNVVMLERKVKIASQDYELAKQKLEYFQKAQEAGVVEGVQLWSQVEGVNTAQSNVYLAMQQYETSLIEVSRQYGGNQWTELKMLVNAHAKTENQTASTPANPVPEVVVPSPEVPAAPPVTN